VSAFSLPLLYDPTGGIVASGQQALPASRHHGRETAPNAGESVAHHTATAAMVPGLLREGHCVAGYPIRGAR